jgi:hypothetical protein
MEPVAARIGAGGNRLNAAASSLEDFSNLFSGRATSFRFPRGRHAGVFQ